ncbi:MAG TPA: helix-turn-helix transcriptional regulator [Mycobacteriales bacterium]|jgi:AraC-like DNA-binding protein|nr:helix-turn-helix transcriptional regulator [Mycobacteriales bacterium]
MTVFAQAADYAPSAVTPEMVRVRPNSAVRAGAYPYDAADVVTRWHMHDLHQIEYAVEGTAQVETATARYLLPPQQAVWIPAFLPHRTTLRRVRSVSVFLDPSMITGKGDRARVLAVPPVFREMAVYGARWPIDRAASDDVADSYFETLAILIGRWLDDEVPWHLPSSDEPVVSAAMRYTDAHLDTATLRDVCAAVAVSERTLRRRFADATGISWRQYQLHSRLLRAMTLLAEPGATVLSVATKVGFDSGSAFARAFTAYTGQSPSSYRRRGGPLRT